MRRQKSEVVYSMRSTTPNDLFNNRRSERGAALITAVLLSMLMLAAGGALIMTSTMSGLTARDSTAEMQAYYAAEAGVARALEVLRGNAVSNPAGTRATFKSVLCTPTLWNSTSGNLVNVDTAGTSKFRVTSIIDPDNLDTITNCALPAYKPMRLRILLSGYGTRDSKKNMEVVVDRYTLTYPVNATVTLPNTSGNPISFSLGGSNVTSASGTDASGGGGPAVAAFAVAGSDSDAVNNVIDGCLPDGTNCGGSGPNVYPADPLPLTGGSGGNTPSFLQSVTTARQFLYGSEGMMNTAMNQGRYFTSQADAYASAAGIGANSPDGVLTFVDGDLTLGPGNPTGRGTVIVTGNLTLNGNFAFEGVIMVLGGGEVHRTGGGHGDVFGAIFVAKFARTGSSTDTFQAPVFDTSGGGTSNIQYNSDFVDKAKSVGGHAVVGIREY
jgi:hypothetical protein